MAKRKSSAKTIHLTHEMRIKKAINEFHHFLSTATEAEKNVVRHVKVGIGPEAVMQEIRRLLGESMAKCKVIPFPQERKRKNADLALCRNGKIEPTFLELDKGIKK
ncbi:hypothetical protein [Nitrosomonas marina]|uniref:Uncharacterized protein n=1 Tax=Nitrosomonas marina TaxID=917 RepID=A0A1H8IGM2_9PROT|nr:hypothetical protein [Nitrosomonas marina]SEN67376.1 hypothetical protein SAMN05216325_13212 [Nitrosomonas marina]